MNQFLCCCLSITTADFILTFSVPTRFLQTRTTTRRCLEPWTTLSSLLMPLACFSGRQNDVNSIIVFVFLWVCVLACVLNLTTRSCVVCFDSGIFGERVPLRYYLTTGMLLSGLFTCLFGLGFYWNIHSIWYYAFVQVRVKSPLKPLSLAHTPPHSYL